jgi:membrane-bound lytic murein transglycosylase F
MVDLSPRAHRIHIMAGLLVAMMIFALLVAIPKYSEEPLTHVQRIQKYGALKVLTLNGASTYYQDADGPDGFEYQLSRLFAEFLGVSLQIKTVDNYSGIYNELIFGGSDLAAAGLSPQDADIPSRVMFGPSYHEVHQQILYRKGLHKRPVVLKDLQNGVVEVVHGTSHETILKQLQKKMPELSWRSNKDIASEELIELVDEGLIDYILADSHEIALQRRFFPELRIAFEIPPPKLLRWAYKESDDLSIRIALDEFFKTIHKDGRLDQLIHRYYSHVAKFNYSDLQTFSQHVRERLPDYRDIFEHEAKEAGMDWHLLAAIGYQESLWNPKAKSPTGVRGLMMLTQSTAKMLNISNRLNPEQSIRGGARYFKRVLAKIPERIPQPDRTWLALASYNVGFGHLEDARKITQLNNGDPDKWIDVKENLPLLSRKKWYKNTEHGYARGQEPVKYVENIRKYTDLLEWIEIRENGEQVPSQIEPPANNELTLPPSF